MSAAPILYATAAPPKLLLDANVFRALANEHSLDQYKDRLLKIATCRTPPVLWACPTTFEEIAGHVRTAEAHRFEHIREAICWMDRLCGNDGMAEDLQWVMLCGIFANPKPYDRSESIATNQLKRMIIKARSFSELGPEFPSAVEIERTQHLTMVDTWTVGYKAVVDSARQPPSSGAKLRETKEMVTRAILEGTRSQAETFGPLWGALKSEADQARDQREMIAHETARLMKGANDPNYKIEKHRNDFNDHWLCAYISVGYTLVTSDGGLLSALRSARCEDPRVVDVGQAVEMAENYLNSRSVHGPE